MSKVTSKLQVTLPKALAERFGIHPGDEVEWEAEGDAIRLVIPTRVASSDREDRLERFDQAMQRQRQREAQRSSLPPAKNRGWKREDLYDRGRPR
jgi:AbrB family looped-hinge helix DNA binding protein